VARTPTVSRIIGAELRLAYSEAALLLPSGSREGKREDLKLRSVWVRNEADRPRFANDRTVCLSAVHILPPRPAPRSFEDTFRRHYTEIRGLLNAHRAPGLAVVVASEDRLEATAWVPSEDDGLNPVIVGRHSTAEVFLPSDPALSLRHLALILRHPQDGPGRFRVLDLRTPTAFQGEHGERLEALESAGPTMVRCASFALLLFPTAESDQQWPDDPDAGWKRVPERVYLHSESADAERWSCPGGLMGRFTPASRDAGAQTISVSFPGPAFFKPAHESAGPARGELRLRSSSGRASLLVDGETARRGVLLGRYERCDAAGLPCLSSNVLSRVHLLVIDNGGALWAIDTASKNGSWLDGRRIRRTRLDGGKVVTLANSVTVQWFLFH
jgi:FHA domain